MNKSRKITVGIVTGVFALAIGVAIDMDIAHSGEHALHACVRRNNELRGLAYVKLDGEPSCFTNDHIVNWEVSVKPPSTTIPKTTTTRRRK